MFERSLIEGHFFFFNDTATTEIYTLSLHDALPIYDLFAALAIYCLSMGSVTSYARARAESLGMQPKVGIAEPATRLVSILVVTGLADLANILGVGEKALWATAVTLGLLAIASTITVVQRILVVRTQALAAPTSTAG